MADAVHEWTQTDPLLSRAMQPSFHNKFDLSVQREWGNQFILKAGQEEVLNELFVAHPAWVVLRGFRKFPKTPCPGSHMHTIHFFHAYMRLFTTCTLCFTYHAKLGYSQSTPRVKTWFMGEERNNTGRLTQEMWWLFARDLRSFM